MMRNKMVRLKQHVVNRHPEETDMEVVTETVDLPPPLMILRMGFLCLKNLYLSCDPLMKKHNVSLDSGNTMAGNGVCKVLNSGYPFIKDGDYVCGLTNWEEYTIVRDGRHLFKINHPEVPLSYYASILGMPGLTAYGGFFKVCSPVRGEFVFISAASSFVGQLVGQFARLMGCYVVGGTESNEKVDLLKNTFGFNDAFNYNNETNLSEALKRCFPFGIDICFENSNGSALELLITAMRSGGRIAICEMLPTTVNNLHLTIPLALRIQGFQGNDFTKIYEEFEEKMVKWLQEDKIRSFELTVHGLENAPAAQTQAFSGLSGENQMVVVVAAPDQVGEPS